MNLVSKRPIQITIHHKHEDIKKDADRVDMDKLEESMLKEDPKKDDLYAKFEETIAEVNDIMGGSDR